MREDGAAPVAIDVEGWVCPMPLRDAPNIVMGHGGGGAMSGELIERSARPHTPISATPRWSRSTARDWPSPPIRSW
jgi:hydrogenase expression/formation protein HypE